MHHHIDITWNPQVIGHIGVDERETVTTKVVFDVAGLARDQIVYRDDFVTTIEERITKMRAEKPSSTGYNNSSH